MGEEQEWESTKKAGTLLSCHNNPHGTGSHYWEETGSSDRSSCAYCGICSPFPQLKPSFEESANANIFLHSVSNLKRKRCQSESDLGCVGPSLFSQKNDLTNILKPLPIRLTNKVGMYDEKKRKEERKKENLEWVKKDENEIENILLGKIAKHSITCRDTKFCLIHEWSRRFDFKNIYKGNDSETKENLDKFMLNDICIKNERGSLIDFGKEYYKSLIRKEKVSDKDLTSGMDEILIDIYENNIDENDKKMEEMKKRINQLWSIPNP